MRPSTVLVLSLTLTCASASWFGSDTPQYNEWSSTELKQWLNDHGVKVPESYSQQQLKDLVQSNWNSASAWTAEQYSNAQKSFADIREASFDAWDESKLREFLLEQGVVAPTGPREQLVLLAKSKYADYTRAASTLSAQASTAVYGDSTHQFTNSASSVIAQATRSAARQLDDNKDYVYSTWEDSQLREYLEKKGTSAKDIAEKKRADLLVMMRDGYAAVATPIWEAWSTSYLREWLIAHGIFPASAPPPTTDVLKAKMATYYYDVNDRVWGTWTDSDLKAWLVSHSVIKSDTQIAREKLVKLIEDNYSNAQDTLWGAWSDSQMREWLVEHGVTNVPAKRDELIKLMHAKYDGTVAAGADYLTWPDARLRAYLRNRGIDESALPTDRPGLLQETRIRWVQARTTFERIREIVNSGVEATEEKLGQVLKVLAGEGEKTKKKAEKKAEKGKENVKKAGGEL